MSTGDPRLLDRMRNIDPYEFEHFVAELWERQGWETEVIQASGDAGVDLVAEKHDGPIDQRIVIQVKRYDKTNPVGGPEIQQYASLRRQEDADVAVVVTTSYFTNPAKERADEHQVKLVDAEDLAQLIADYDASDLVEQYAPRLDPDHGAGHPDDEDIVLDVADRPIDPAETGTREVVPLPAVLADDDMRRYLLAGGLVLAAVALVAPGVGVAVKFLLVLGGGTAVVLAAAPEDVMELVNGTRTVYGEYDDGATIAENTNGQLQYEPADGRAPVPFDGEADPTIRRQSAVIYATIDRKVGGLQSAPEGAIPTRITSMGQDAIIAYRFAVHGEYPDTIAGDMGLTQTEVVDALREFAERPTV